MGATITLSKKRNGCHFSSSGWCGLPASSSFPEWPRSFISFIPVQLFFHSCGSVLLHSALCILDFLQDSPLWSLGLAFVGHGGLYSSMYLSSKVFPYGGIFLKVSSVVNLLKPLQHKDSWLFHYGSQMREAVVLVPWHCLLGVYSPETIREASLIEQALGLWFPSRELPPPACGRSILLKGAMNPGEN